MIFQFLYDLIDLFRAYFDGKFDEASFRENFTLVYELLDEVMDNGLPQITSADLLKEYIKTTNKDVSLRSRLKNRKKQQEGSGSSSQKMGEITAAITGRMDWRPPSDYSYSKNEVYLDVLENVNLLMSRTGEILHMNATGKVVMRTTLSGMPEARIGINDKLCIKNTSKALHQPQFQSSAVAPADPNFNNTASPRTSVGGKAIPGAKGKKGSSYIHLNDIKLHRCVRLGQFDEDRSIMFVPPDGEFELMRYSVSNLSLPFRVHPNIMEKGNPSTRIVYDVKVESKFASSMYSTDIKLFIPTPGNANECNVKVNHGKIKYEPDQHVCFQLETI